MSVENISVKDFVPRAGLTYENKNTFTFSGEQIAAVAKTNFNTHFSEIGEKLHSFSQALLVPAREFAQALAAVVEPQSGEDKDNAFWGGS